MKQFHRWGKIVVLGIFLMSVLLAACGPSEEKLAKAIEETKSAEESQTAEARKTDEAEAQAATQTQEAKIDVPGTQTAEALAATEQFHQAQTETSIAEATDAALMVYAFATESAQQMLDVVMDLYNEGELANTDGEYYPIMDFHEEWAQLGWYQWWGTGYSPDDFIIRADASWESASDTADWWFSGCGFVFREDGVDNHYVAWLGMDGYVYIARTVNGQGALLGGVGSYYKRLDVPSDSAEIMLVVEGDRFTFFVDGERVANRVDGSLKSGNLALTMLSGTNKGYGTRCNMENVDLWILE